MLCLAAQAVVTVMMRKQDPVHQITSSSRRLTRMWGSRQPVAVLVLAQLWDLPLTEQGKASMTTFMFLVLLLPLLRVSKNIVTHTLLPEHSTQTAATCLAWLVIGVATADWKSLQDLMCWHTLFLFDANVNWLYSCLQASNIARTYCCASWKLHADNVQIVCRTLMHCKCYD